MAKKVKIKSLFEGIRGWEIKGGSAEKYISGIEDSSARVKKGDLFICIKGFKSDGHRFAAQAVRKGAAAVVAEKNIKLPKGAVVVKVKDTKKTLIEIAGRFYGEDLKKTDVYGITGTNGKTTVSYLISSMLKASSKKDNTVIGTIHHVVGRKIYKAVTTTPSNVFTNKLISETASKGMKDVIMEVSSHALDQGRVDNIKLRAAVITNVTRDHLDYHGNYASYLAAKMKIIGRIRAGGVLVVNADSLGSGKIIKAARKRKIKLITCSSAKKAAIKLVSSEMSIKGVKFVLDIKGKKHAFESGLIGEHNIYNIMSAVGAVMDRVKMSDIKKAVKNFRAVKGRLEKVFEGEFTVLVDYAHTPDSLEKVLESLNGIKKGRVIAVFGAAGNRDRGKRPLMGAIAEKLSDIPVLTSDNPRFEDPDKIIRGVLAGVKDKEKMIVEADRERAINTGIRLARKDDIVVVAGKGHEDYQEIMGKRHAFDDTKKSVKAAAASGTKLYQLLAFERNNKIVKGSDEIRITSVEESSKEVKKGSVFVCVRGFNTDGHRFASEAVKRGAAAVVAEKKIPVGRAALVVVRDTKKAMMNMADIFYGREKAKAVITGVTGTNGKSTVSHLIGGILKKAERRDNSVLGTINYRIGKKVYGAPNTTPSNITLHKLISETVRSGYRDVVMEVSSHALDQERVKNIVFDTAVITNITRDHLDYHKSFKAYSKAKEKITGMIKKDGRLVVNADDPASTGIIRRAAARRIKVVSFGVKNNADIKASAIKSGIDGIAFKFRAGKKKMKLESSLIGEHNIYNILAAAGAAGNRAGAGDIKSAVKEFRTLRGRLEKIYSNGITVFIDFAHTPDGLERVIRALNSVKKNRLITVFGTAGNRDKGKRPLMGAIAEKLSDEVIITSDNPRFEEPLSIIKDITAGMKGRKISFIEPDRKRAIELGVMMAGKGDTVLITGKGHQEHQEIMGKKVVFHDRKVAVSALKRKKWN